MTREAIAAQLRADTYALMKRCDAHIVVGMTIGADGGVSECSSVMTDEQTAYLMHRLTLAGRAAIAAINAGGPLPLATWKDPRINQPKEGEPCFFITHHEGTFIGRWYRAAETPNLVGSFRTITDTGISIGFNVWSTNAFEVSLWTEATPPAL